MFRYIVVENLRDLLRKYDPNEPLYLGCRFKGFVDQGYMAGGAGYFSHFEILFTNYNQQQLLKINVFFLCTSYAGYVLSKEAVRRLVTDGIGNKKCRMKNDGGDEDAILGTYFYEYYRQKH